jgi:hypothetical protein
MNDLDQRLRSALGQLATARTPESESDVLFPVRTRVRRRHRTRLGAIVAAPLVALSAIAWATWPEATDETPVVTDPAPTATSVEDAKEEAASTDEIAGVVELDPGPLAERYGAAVVDLEDGRILVWGGGTDVNFGFDSNTAFRDGAVYDTATFEWQPIADAPFLSDGEGSLAVFTGTEMIAFGGERSAAWDPLADSWRELDRAPGDMAHAVWTGDRVIAWERWDLDTLEPRWAVLDPASGTWSEVPAPPVALERVTAAWSGSELIVVGHPAGARGYLPAEGAAFDPVSGAWRRLPTAPVDSQSMGSAWLQDRMLVVNYDMGAAEYDPATDTWRSLPQVPGEFSESGVDVVASGDRALVLAGGVWLHTPDRKWVPVPPSLAALATMVGTRHGDVFAFGREWSPDADAFEGNAFNVFHLAVLEETRQIAVGRAVLDLPDDAVFVSAVGDGLSGPSSSRTFTVSLGSTTCTIETRDGETVTSTSAGTVTIDPIHGEPDWGAHRLDGSNGTSIGHGGHRIDCGSLEQSIELARHIRPGEYWYAE